MSSGKQIPGHRGISYSVVEGGGRGVVVVVVVVVVVDMVVVMGLAVGRGGRRTGSGFFGLFAPPCGGGFGCRFF